MSNYRAFRESGFSSKEFRRVKSTNQAIEQLLTDGAVDPALLAVLPDETKDWLVSVKKVKEVVSMDDLKADDILNLYALSNHSNMTRLKNGQIRITEKIRKSGAKVDVVGDEVAVPLKKKVKTPLRTPTEKRKII